MLAAVRRFSWRGGRASRRFVAARKELQDRAIEVGGVTIRSRWAQPPGSTPGQHDPPLVLLAGLGLSGRYLAPLAAELAIAHTVWVPDPPGFGRSGRPTSVLDIAELGDATVAWMDAVGIRRAVLVGNSAGCQIAVEAAVRHPDRVAGVVLDAPTIDADARSVARHVGRIVADAFREPLSLWGLQAYDWAAAGPRRLVVTTRHVFAHAVEQRLPLVGCPALVLRGSRDPIVPQRWAEAVASGLPNGRLHVDRGGTHAGPYSAPDRLAPIITTFVSAHCTAAELVDP